MTIVGKLTAHVEALNGAHVVQKFDATLGTVSKPLVPEIVGGRTSNYFAALVRVLVGLKMRISLACVVDIIDIFGLKELTKIQQIKAVTFN